MLVAASPVEIEAKAEEAGMEPQAHEVAVRLFHTLTDRIAKAAIAQGEPRWSRAHETWPNRRFYFGTEGHEMAALMEGLAVRPGIMDVAGGRDRAGLPDGLFGCEEEDGFVAVLVAHRDLQGTRSAT
jgi:hypothetical protein